MTEQQPTWGVRNARLIAAPFMLGVVGLIALSTRYVAPHVGFVWALALVLSVAFATTGAMFWPHHWLRNALWWGVSGLCVGYALFSYVVIGE